MPANIAENRRLSPATIDTVRHHIADAVAACLLPDSFVAMSPLILIFFIMFLPAISPADDVAMPFTVLPLFDAASLMLPPADARPAGFDMLLIPLPDIFTTLLSHAVVRPYFIDAH